MKTRLKIFFLLPIFVLTSCIPKKTMVYMQDVKSTNNATTKYEPLIQKDDILFINVSAQEEQAVIPFNLDTKSIAGSGAIEKQTYLVDTNGNIDFPVIGTINVANYSINEIKIILKRKLSKYVTDAVVNVRIMNFKVSVLGEVNNPGTINVSSQRFTLLEAIAMSGDLTLFGKRNNILIMRETQGVKTTARIDITKPDFIDSEYYYLDQNDVIYVEPNKKKIDSTAIGTNITGLISILGFVITTTILLTR